MRENRLRTLWAADKPVVNSWLTIPDAFCAETLAHAGFDSLTVDMQHGLISFEAAVSMLTAISSTPTVPVVRVPWLDPGIIMKMLDAGAYGIICPMVNTRAGAELFVSALRYPPAGIRSFGPARALLYAGSDYLQHANNTVAGLAMIETREALDNLDEILSVKGLDAVYIGPNDLALSLGHEPRSDVDEPQVIEAIELILAKAQQHGVIAGMHNSSADYARRWVDKGFRFVTVGADVSFLAGGAARALSELGASSGDAT
ncbi:HpcH/HpaI aldolase family protein [Methylobacterium oxalidis]|uniref:2,4-dihydroxyhept-2-ene-1,7-dioic acid aldolase n=1 Tax=Methylobacterium oxalidis TaxID=944322 RepID=A0A512JD36_9HYPH|nr:aldolase/citrate lyase family protein [Methylobacterium oxalidis]GEP07873.1 2,4-dihydroxyhept-2-ene-1,7-dioic acid aldolase [Methylobacterium oxalidis]GJE35762.1 4-hydroxy-2-oxo-heptane-1,7-dioate aldolase [Methylobacterium oxalidis]GLS62508.1 2,4-dihydroxyhept-2-ene-1,7-dioic acid aldolase [Methylobacterium oxalidis]